MPYSSNIFDGVIQEHIRTLQPTSILDVGAGAGQKGSIIRSTGYTSTLDALEPTQSYIDKFKLNNIYTTIFQKNIHQFLEENWTFNYDVIVFGDVLEHMYRSAVIDVLDYCLYKSKYIIAVWPRNLPQDAWGGNPYEIHRSNFELADLTKFNVIHYQQQALGSVASLHYIVLKGHMSIP